VVTVSGSCISHATLVGSSDGQILVVGRVVTVAGEGISRATLAG
jgi:hypothetical protein